MTHQKRTHQWSNYRRVVAASFAVFTLVAAATGCATPSSSGAAGNAAHVSLATSTASGASSASTTAVPTAAPSTPTVSATPSAPTSSAAPATHAAQQTTKPTPARTTHSATPTHKPTPKPTPKPTTKPKSLCGAPSNPWGYNFCGGGFIYSPPSSICSYFRPCIGNFSNGKGYLVECKDGDYSMSGGRSGACSDHKGEWRPVYS